MKFKYQVATFFKDVKCRFFRDGHANEKQNCHRNEKFVPIIFRRKKC